MSVINSIFNAIFDGFFALTGMIGGNPAMWIISILAGVGLLFIFKWTSNQKEIKRVKDRISAGFLAIRLFKDDFKQVSKANGSVFGYAFLYLFNAMIPMLVMMVPVLLMLAQLNHWYGYEPLRADTQPRVLAGLLEDNEMTLNNAIIGNTSTTVTADIAEGVDMSTAEISLETGDGLRVVTPAIVMPDIRQVSWRIQAIADGEHEIRISVDGKSVAQTVYVGESEKFRKISPVTTRDFWGQVFFPANSSPPADVPINEVRVVYAEADYNLLGMMEMHWIIAFFIISLVFGFALKGAFGVEI